MRRTTAKFGQIAVLVIGTLVAQPTTAETLTDALVSAYNNSDLLNQSRALLRAADEDVALAVSALRPTLGYQVDGRYDYNNDPAFSQFQDSYFLSINLISEIALYTGGRNKFAIEASKEAVLAAREALITQEQQILFGAVDAYMTVYASVEIVQLQENSVRVLQEEVRAARDRFEVGEVTRTDVAQAEARLAQADADLVAAQGDLQTARELYNLEVGRYPGVLAAPPPLPSTPPSLQAARDVGLRQHPRILQVQRLVTVDEINVVSAEAAVLPTLTGSVSAGFAETNEGFFDVNDPGGSASVGLRLSGPIYQGGALNALFRRSKAQRDNTRSQLLRTTAEISELVGRSWAVRDVSQARLVATDRQIEAAQIAFDGTREEATLGARTTLDVLDAEQDLLDAQASRIDASAQEQRAVYALLLSMGRLTVDYLGLSVVKYDPAAYYNAVSTAPAIGSEQGIQLDRVLKSIGR